MAFTKASPKQARLKVSMYGPPGSGKTFTTLLMAEGLAKLRGGRIAYVDTERGTDFYAQAVPARRIHPDEFDFDALYTKSLAEVWSSVRALNHQEHAVVVLDSISHLWQAAIDAYEGKRTSLDTIPMQAWGKIKKPYKDLVNYLIGSPFDVFVLGRQKNLFEEDLDGKLRNIGVAMRAEGETQYEPHICLRMESKQDQQDTTSATYLMHVEKDRSGVLAGRTIANPTFQTIEPLLPLLGDEQAASEDEDERISADAELLEANEAKAKAKEDKSSGILADLAAKLQSAASLEDLGAVRAEANKLRRQMVANHVEALRAVIEARTKDITAAAVGSL